MTPRRSFVLLAAAAAAAATVTALAGCSVTSSSSTGTTGSSSPVATQFGTAAPGVTASTIKIGVVFPDFASIAQYGLNINQGSFQNAYTVLINKINAAGGVNGREIVPVFAKFNLVSPAAATQTCVQLTDDDKVFAILGEYESDTQALCYAQTHKTAVVGSSLSTADYALAKAPWFAYDHGGDDAASAIDAFAADGQFTGKKVAVIALQQDSASMNQSAIPELKTKGVIPVSTAVITASVSDATALGSQVSVAVQKFQSSGANVVITVGGLATEYPPIEAKTTYRPTLLFTSASDVNSSTAASRVSPAVYKGALASDVGTDFNDPAQQSCIQTMEAAYPSLNGKLTNPNLIKSGQPTLATSVMNACAELALFTDVAAKAGKNLNYSTYQEAGITLGKVHIPGYTGDANYTQSTPYGDLPFAIFAFNPATSQFVEKAVS